MSHVNQASQQVWLIHPHDVEWFIFCGICIASGSSCIRKIAPLQLHYVTFTVLIFIANQRDSALIRRNITTFSLSSSPCGQCSCSSFNLSVMLWTFSCFSSCRTQKTGFSWMWMSRFPWCAVSWLRTQSWKKDTMLWASHREHSFCM